MQNLGVVAFLVFEIRRHKISFQKRTSHQIRIFTPENGFNLKKYVFMFFSTHNNIDSLYKHSDELKLFSDEHSPHVICLSQRKLNQDICDELLQIDGFQKIIRKDRSGH